MMGNISTKKVDISYVIWVDCVFDACITASQTLKSNKLQWTFSNKKFLCDFDTRANIKSQ